MNGVPLLALLVVSGLWGGHAVVGKAVETHLSVFPLTIWRFTLCAVCYLPFYNRLFRIFRLPRRAFYRLLICGLCWAVLYPLFYYESLLYLTPVAALLLVNTSPLLAAVIGQLFFRERISLWGWIGIVVSFMGVLLLIVGGPLRASFVGIILAFIASAAFALYSVLSRPLFQSLPLVDVLTSTSIFGVVILWIIAIFSGQAKSVVIALHGLDFTGWVGLLYIVLFVSTIAYVFYGFGLRRVPSGIASAITFYPQVPIAAVIQWIWLGIVPAPSLATSAALILAGTALMSRKQKKRSVRQEGAAELLFEHEDG